jgi:hypothetical protein
MDTPWQPPRTDLDDRPNVAPAGYRYYGGIDYLLWWTQHDHPVTALPGAAAATDFEPLTRHGVRGVFGLWLNSQQQYAVEVAGFALADAGADHDFTARYHTHLADAEIDLRAELYRGTWAHLDLLAGFRYLRFDESLQITEPNFTDECGTRNRFYGGQLGLEMELHREAWFVDLWAKVALGADCEVLRLDGRQRHQEFAAVPEFGINVGYQLTQHIRVSAGYSFLYLSDAARPAEQIDSLLRTPRPAMAPIRSNDFWGQGLNLGLEFRF